MQTRKRHLWAVVIAAIVSILMIMGTVSAVVYIKQRDALHVTIHRSDTSATSIAKHTAHSRKGLPDGQDWTQYRFDVSGTGLNPEGRISVNTVTHLSRQWAVHPNRAFGSTPAVVNGLVYATNGNSLYSLDLSTGETAWHFDGIPQPHGAITSSVAVDPSTYLAYYGTPDARVYAVDTLTGKEVWEVQIGAPEAGAFIWSSPLVVHSKVYIGLASHDDNPCVRGAVFAFDAMTGKVAWRHYMTRVGTLGGGVWSSLIAVPSAHEIIATTGNPCPYGDSDDQEDAFVAMDWDTGASLWQYTAVSHDDCDCDFGEGAVDYVYHGQEYLVAGNKNGIVYALAPLKERHGVRLAWSLRIAKPGFLGYGGIFQPPTYSNGLVFIAGGPTPDGACNRGKLFALQADTGAVRWSVCTSGQVVSPTSTSGDVLFVVQRSTLVAYESLTGLELWRAEQSGEFWGGVAISRGAVLVGSVDGVLYCYSFAELAKPSISVP